MYSALLDINGLVRGDMVLRDDGTYILSDDTQYQSWLSGGGVLGAPVAPPEPMPETISDRQFFQQLAVQGVITQDEALSAVKTGTIPAALAALVSALPANQQFGTEMILSGATQFQRSHPLTAAIGQAYGWSSDQIDTFWQAAAEL